MNAGQRIKKLQLERKISQNKLARMAGISQAGLSYIVNGQGSPSEETLRRIAGALEVSLSDLMGELQPQDMLSPVQRRIIEDYRGLSDEGKQYVRKQLYVALQLYARQQSAADMA